MIPAALAPGLSLPIIVAPMFLVSGPDLVIESCRAGLIGSFPAAGARTIADCDAWLSMIAAGRQAGDAVFAINIVVHASRADRTEAELGLAERHRVPLVITSVGDPTAAVRRVHEWSGLVFHDVATVRHAERAIEAGVDGLILLTAGAGGHTGFANPFAMINAVRRIFSGPIALAGAISTGRDVAAAQMMGADFAYMGTRFAATAQSLACSDYKRLLLEQELTDILVTDRISGASATFMRGSIRHAGLDPDALSPRRGPFEPDLPPDVQAWRDIWSAGHGVGAVRDVPSVSALALRLQREHRDAIKDLHDPT